MAGSSWTQSKWSQNYINGSNYANDLSQPRCSQQDFLDRNRFISFWLGYSLCTFARLQYQMEWYLYGNRQYACRWFFQVGTASPLATSHHSLVPLARKQWEIHERYQSGLTTWRFVEAGGQTGNQSGLGDYSYLARYKHQSMCRGLARKWCQCYSYFLTGQPEQSWVDLGKQQPRPISVSTWPYWATASPSMLITIIKKTKDMLMNITLPTGGAAAKTLSYNGGSMINKGWEFAISSQNLTGALKWNTDFNISFNKE